jgi:hypothetical protein
MPLLRRRGNANGPNESSISRPAALDVEPDANPTLPLNHAGDDAVVTNDIQSRASSATTRPRTPPIQEESNRHKRFSVLRFRNASDSQLSLRARQQAEKPPPLPQRRSTRLSTKFVLVADNRVQLPKSSRLPRPATLGVSRRRAHE